MLRGYHNVESRKICVLILVLMEYTLRDYDAKTAEGAITS